MKKLALLFWCLCISFHCIAAEGYVYDAVEFSRRARRGYFRAMRVLAEHNEETDPACARRWYLKMSDHDGTGVSEEEMWDFKEARGYAAFVVAKMMYNGIGGVRDYASAERKFRQALIYYVDDVPEDKDPDGAIEFARLLLDKPAIDVSSEDLGLAVAALEMMYGHINFDDEQQLYAMFLLGRLLRERPETEDDVALGDGWLRHAAHHGSEDAGIYLYNIFLAEH